MALCRPWSADRGPSGWGQLFGCCVQEDRISAGQVQESVSSGGLRTAVSEYRRCRSGRSTPLRGPRRLSRSSRTTRRPATVAPKRRILVFTEGQATEPHLHHSSPSGSPRACRGDPRRPPRCPLTLVKLAVEALTDARRTRGTAFVEVWCVFDVDEHPDLVEDS